MSDTFEGITLQKQPTPVTCMQTCLAMALGVPVQEVIDRYGSEPFGVQRLLFALEECGFVWNMFVFPRIVSVGWHFVSVPSLNHTGGMHEVLIHMDADANLTILDPACGTTYDREGKMLKSWSDVVLFAPNGKLPHD